MPLLTTSRALGGDAADPEHGHRGAWQRAHHGLRLPMPHRYHHSAGAARIHALPCGPDLPLPSGAGGQRSDAEKGREEDLEVQTELKSIQNR